MPFILPERPYLANILKVLRALKRFLWNVYSLDRGPLSCEIFESSRSDKRHGTIKSYTRRALPSFHITIRSIFFHNSTLQRESLTFQNEAFISSVNLTSAKEKMRRRLAKTRLSGLWFHGRHVSPPCSAARFARKRASTANCGKIFCVTAVCPVVL